ncbi:MAG TPA: hypothetical protein VII68_08115 [Casimicrobiaceae bacterium]|jgi:hypothetical protein
MALTSLAMAAVPDGPPPAGPLGLHDAADFVVTTGDYSSLAPPPRLYFAKEWIAVPRDGVPVAGFATGVTAFDDVRAWSTSVVAGSKPDVRPALVWIGSPERMHGAKLAPDAKTMVADGATRPFALAPRLASNGSWFDASSASYFTSRDVALRGTWRGDGTFEARVLWPEDFRLDARLPVAPLETSQGSVQAALRTLVRADGGGARTPWSTRVVWERPRAARSWDGKPVLIVMVNGAQGDDDEAWGGHFAIGTGRIGRGGDLADVMVDNFYSLDVVSEKGILAAPTPLDAYLADLNSGQAWYRPSAILVAVLADDDAARRVQGAFDRVYAQFWRHQLPYGHSTMNCSGISVDTLRAAGWTLPEAPANLGASALGWLALPFTLVKERSVSQARVAYEYLTQDRTRLFPAVAFEVVGASLVDLAQGRARADASPLERALARDLEALVFVHVPQLPSSRAFGSWPVASPAEYHGKVPTDPEDVKRVPVPARPYPSNLRDPDLLPPARRPSDLPLAVWVIVAVAAAVAVFGWVVARFR